MKSAVTAVAPPPLDADPIILVDWLELVAFFDHGGSARLDEIDNVFAIQDEEDARDDATDDALKDARREAIENEIIDRSKSLRDAYPFEMSSDGEELIFKPRGRRRGASFYLTCLLISHFKKSPILLSPPSEELAARVRKKQFQTLATLAVAGQVKGPAVSFGWPRATGESIIEAVQRCCEMSGTGTPRNPPGPEASARAKDGGMDVIAWQPAVNDAPPPAAMFFGQAASGHNWSGKSSLDELGSFLEGYFLDKPACNLSAVTIVPHRLTREEHNRYGRRHGLILDRVRTPRAALEGLQLALDAKHPVDEVCFAQRLNHWLLRYRNKLKNAA